MSKFPTGTLVDLYDSGFQQWRGEYTVLKTPEEAKGYYKIKNTRTGSQQFVREAVLRVGRLGPFKIESLQ